MKETIAVLGGTGFIGRVVVKRLRQAGFTVSVMARNIEKVSSLFEEKNIRPYRGDIRNITDVCQAIAGATQVINLAHNGGGSWEEMRERMVGGTETVAEACLQNGNVPLIHISSIAALYLGPQLATITGATPADSHEDRRPYARAKAMCEELLLRLQRDAGLHLCILRPGLVVGAGTSPFHSGLGSYNNEQDCVGWNSGRNPLPFVLVDDVADAIVLACTNPIADGKIYNLVGDVRPCARDYFAQLGETLNRPLRFHAINPYWLYLSKLSTWYIKRLIGKRVVPPSLRDIRSRGLEATFDCSDVKNDLGWKPVADQATFFRKAFESVSGLS